MGFPFPTGQAPLTEMSIPRLDGLLRPLGIISGGSSDLKEVKLSQVVSSHTYRVDRWKEVITIFSMRLE